MTSDMMHRIVAVFLEFEDSFAFFRFIIEISFDVLKSNDFLAPDVRYAPDVLSSSRDSILLQIMICRSSLFEKSFFSIDVLA